MHPDINWQLQFARLGEKSENLCQMVKKHHSLFRYFYCSIPVVCGNILSFVFLISNILSIVKISSQCFGFCYNILLVWLFPFFLSFLFLLIGNGAITAFYNTLSIVSDKNKNAKKTQYAELQRCEASQLNSTLPLSYPTQPCSSFTAVHKNQ